MLWSSILCILTRSRGGLGMFNAGMGHSWLLGRSLCFTIWLSSSTTMSTGHRKDCIKSVSMNALMSLRVFIKKKTHTMVHRKRQTHLYRSEMRTRNRCKSTRGRETVRKSEQRAAGELWGFAYSFEAPCRFTPVSVLIEDLYKWGCLFLCTIACSFCCCWIKRVAMS